MKKGIGIVMVVGLLSMFFLMPKLQGAEGIGTVKENFPDGNLRKEITLILGKEENEQITQADVDRVSSLMIKNKNILSMEGIGVFTKLTYLDLSSEALEEVPVEIGKLKDLRILYLNDNKLNTLPEEIGDLEKLEVLSLSGNNLSMLPGSLGKLSRLEQLVLTANRLISLPKEIGNLENLEILILEENLIEELPLTFAKLKNLTILDLGKNRMTTLSEVLADLSSLYFVDLSLNHIHKLDMRSYTYLIGLKGCYLFNQEYQESLLNRGSVDKNYSFKALDIYKEDLGYEVSHVLIKPDGKEIPLVIVLEGDKGVVDGVYLDTVGTYTLKTIVSGGQSNSFGDSRFGNAGSIYRQSFEVQEMGSLPGVMDNNLLFYGGAALLVAMCLFLAVRIARLRGEE